MFQYVLFDLDGTLTDPEEGITKSVQYALNGMGIEEPDLKKLVPFIGPPLKDSFMEFYKLDSEGAENAIRIYRERFSKIGLFENRVYEGIRELLHACREAGILLAVASSKPKVFVDRVLAHFDLESCFDVIVGSELNGVREKKEEVVEEALRQLEELTSGRGMTILSQIFNRNNCAMVGDRKYDVQGGKQFRLFTVGVTYGYAEDGELEEAGADKIVNTIEELKDVLLK